MSVRPRDVIARELRTTYADGTPRIVLWPVAIGTDRQGAEIAIYSSSVVRRCLGDLCWNIVRANCPSIEMAVEIAIEACYAPRVA